MRRHLIWYVLAVAWFLGALLGLLRHHGPQAIPAALFAMLFAIIGVVVGRRDEALRRRRKPVIR